MDRNEGNYKPRRVLECITTNDPHMGGELAMTF